MSTPSPSPSPTHNPSMVNTWWSTSGYQIILYILLAFIVFAIGMCIHNIARRARFRYTLWRGRSPQPSEAWRAGFLQRRRPSQRRRMHREDWQQEGVLPRPPQGVYLPGEEQNRLVEGQADERSGPNVWSVGTCRDASPVR